VPLTSTHPEGPERDTVPVVGDVRNRPATRDNPR
jgi:hypothetical protein